MMKALLQWLLVLAAASQYYGYGNSGASYHLEKSAENIFLSVMADCFCAPSLSDNAGKPCQHHTREGADYGSRSGDNAGFPAACRQSAGS